jgi:hypothetical protein
MDDITTAITPIQVVYPETDGKPMGETDVQIDALIYLREALKDYFREAPQVYVGGTCRPGSRRPPGSRRARGASGSCTAALTDRIGAFAE